MPEQSPADSASQGPLVDAAWRQVAGVLRTIAGGSSDTGSMAPPPPDGFPGYRVIGEIHRGGQGVVYQALQESTQRHVAIKVLRDSHLLTAGDIARFEQEVRVLARLRHANIVRIFDSSSVGGRFFYVMDYISGRPLDAYVRENLIGLASIRALVQLFVKICDAVNAAHLRGIIHRDLKPGNIRVDDDGEPFVLDFGLSKLVGNENSDVTLSGQFVGSIPWASPEQAAGRTDDIDVRTDVYSLGVLLYQLLTCEFPYSMEGGPHQVLATITTAEPVTPRSRIAGLPIDLETIILKCLQKPRDRRYQNAGELARDLRRFLSGEPIEARRDSYAYVLARQLKRYRLVAFGSVAFLLVVAAGLATSLTFWREAEYARKSAVDERNNAQTQARLATAANAFLNRMLASADRGQQGGNPNVRVRDVLDDAAKLLLADAEQTEPEVRAALLHTVGKTYHSLGLFADAERMLRESLRTRRARLGDSDADVVAAMIDLAAALRDGGRLAESQTLTADALRLRPTLRGERPVLLAAALNEQGQARYVQQDLRGAAAAFEEALEILVRHPPEDPTDLARVSGNLGLALQALGDVDGAERRFRDALRVLRDALGEEHPAIAATLNNLASALAYRGAADEAEALYREALAMRRKLLGEEHALVALTMNNLAGLLHDVRRDYAAAEALFRQALDLRRRTLGELHVDTLASLGNLAGVLQDQGRVDEAEALYRRALAARRSAADLSSGSLVLPLGNLGTLRLQRGDADEAEQLFREAIALLRAAGDADPVTLAVQITNLAVTLTRKCEYGAAEAAMREVIDIRRRLHKPDHPQVVRALGGLGQVMAAQEKFVDAEPILREALRQHREHFGSADPATLSVAANLGQTLSELALQRRQEGAKAAALAAEGEALLRECLETRSRTRETPAGVLAQTRSALGGAIVATLAITRADDDGARTADVVRLLEARALLLDAYAELCAPGEVIASFTTAISAGRACERLARMCDVWDELDAEPRWQEERAAWQAEAQRWIGLRD